MTMYADTQAQTAGPQAASPSPELIMQLAAGFMAAKHLFTASELGLFDALAGSPAGLDALADWWTNPEHTQPRQAVLMAGQFAVNLPNADVYSADEARTWLDRTGWRFAGHRPLAGPQSVIIAQAH